MLMIFLFQYQAPIISTDQVMNSMEKQLNDPPKEWGNSISIDDLKEITSGNIRFNLSQKKGLWNELTNKKQWEIQIEYNGISSTFIIDAYTGKNIDIYGPLN